MKTLLITRYKSSGFSSAFAQINSVEIEDTPFDSGAFGEVYFCYSINGVTLSIPQVVKVLIDDGSGSARRGYETIKKLQDQILSYNNQLKNKKEKPIEEMNALWALPQFSYEGQLDGKMVFGYSANRLNTTEYLLFDKIFNESDLTKRKELRNHFYNLPVERRLQFAYDLAEGFKALQDMSFIYADLNPKNLFVNATSEKLCIIDYDSGAVTNNPHDEAETFGKLGEWLAPEIQDQLLQNLSGNIKVDLNTDTWAVAIAIHFMLFNFHPLFYLKVRGKKELNDYFSHYKWPEINQNDPNFRNDLSKVYEYYIEKLNSAIPSSIKNAFAETINNGYFNPNRRLSYKQWLSAIKGLMVPPTIHSFSASQNTILDKTPVTLKWEIDKHANYIEIDNGIGDVTGKSEITIPAPQHNSIYQIKAVGHFGESTSSVSIRVFPTPIIESILVPAPIVRDVTSVFINYPKFPEVDISITAFPQVIQANGLINNYKLPGFIKAPTNYIQLKKQSNKTTWSNVVRNLFNRFNNINNWNLRKKKAV